ncbi:hypothetical protein IWQ60_001769 [Tieghemiomyces parasiticus]|uniref:Peroxiredoxin-like 2A n=1 Tax=Tieghemiomyces parasiticus TaxID=78921 RepID=A0A9W8AJA4_9FUNG|nr:hypothetical protein IWQ60_001769 [Tieghemiomyces parasiticus]
MAPKPSPVTLDALAQVPLRLLAPLSASNAASATGTTAEAPAGEVPSGADAATAALTPAVAAPSVMSQTLWATQPALVFVVRRPGCRLCREEAVKLASNRDTIEGQLGLNMVAVVHEELGVEEFQRDFWKGPVYLDEQKRVFTALSGGKIKKAPLWNLCMPSVFRSLRRAGKAGVQGNMKGEGRIMGGLFVIKQGDQGIAFQYKEKIFGDHAPMEQVLGACQDASAASPAQPEV